MVGTSSSSFGGIGSVPESRRLLDLLGELDVAPPNRPDDAGELVGQRDGGLVVTALLLEPQGPGPQAVGGVTGLCLPQDGPSAVRQEHSDVDVATLADRAESPAKAARAFTRGESEVAGEVPRGGEAFDVSD